MIDSGFRHIRVEGRLMRCVFFTLLVASFISLELPTASAQNPYDAEIRRLAREVARQGRTPQGILPLYQLSRRANSASPALVDRELERIANNRRLDPSVRAQASLFRGFFAPRWDSSVLEEVSTITDFAIIGGFDNDGRSGLDRAYPPELNQSAPRDESVVYQGKVRPVAWRQYPAEASSIGVLDFDATTRPYENACAYAETFVELDEARDMTLWLGVGGAFKVWVNGEERLRDDVYRGLTLDRHLVPFHGRQGRNRILLKVCVLGGRWGARVRLGEADGSPARNFRVDSSPGVQTDAATEESNEFRRAPTGPLAFFSERYEANEEDVRARFNLARYLAWSASDEPTDVRSRQLAASVAEDSPREEHLLFAASTAESRADRIGFIAQAEEVSPRSSKVRLARLREVMNGADWASGLQLAEALSGNSIEGIQAGLIRSTILARLGLRDASLAELERLSERVPRLDISRRATLLAHSRTEEAHALLEELGERYPEDRGIIGDLIDEASNQGDVERVVEILESSPPAVRRNMAASTLERLGRPEDALEYYRQRIVLTPDEASHHANYAAALLRVGQEAPAAESYRTALALRPQSPEYRAALERIAPEERPDEAWATSTEEILARRERVSRWQISTLHELKVVTVYESGLSSTFGQVAYQVHDEEGARNLRYFPIYYEPGTQAVELRSAKVYRADGTEIDVRRTTVQGIGDSRYRIYYDSSVFLVLFPELEPGDVVEVRYRLEDVSRSNMFNDYYGDIRYFGDTQGPVRFAEHVLITPNSREFFVNEPDVPALTRELRQEGDTTIRRYVMENLDTIRSEEGMPGPAETRPMLHVSTYESWEDVGRWWWGLSQDQLVPDEALIETTRELIAGARNDREKVTRIYDWVIRNTRYVGLEFGIHGFKPYRVTQIVDRGFGDCKDKASLIYAMLTIAGIDARIALIRTTRNGRIDTEPASLAVFDHAIAYVPQFDLYLDGTAEMNGTTELPEMDQGTMTLIVGPETAELRQTPVLEASSSVYAIEETAVVGSSGDATLSVETSIEGTSASYFRSRYQAAGPRTERLQESLRSNFPGVEVTSQTFENLDNFESGLSFEWEGTVPSFADRSGNTLLVAPSQMGNLTQRYAAAERRTHPLVLGSPSTFSGQRRIQPASGVRVTDVPQGGETSSEFGSLSVRYERQGDDVVATTRWVLNVARVSQSDYPAFRRFLHECDVLLRARIQLESGS